MAAESRVKGEVHKAECRIESHVRALLVVDPILIYSYDSYDM